MRLLHIDIETTGLDREKCPILEVAAAIWEDGLVEHTFEELLPVNPAACYWEAGALRLHAASGLYQALVERSNQNSMGFLVFPRETTEDRLVDWLIKNKASGLLPCGFSVHFDRDFLTAQMPKIRQLLHGYRIFDLSTLRAIWKPDLEFKGTQHRAMDDVASGIDFLNHWMDRFKLGPLDYDRMIKEMSK